MELENIRPADIERRSMEIIESETGETPWLTDTERIILKRVIHTTADFDYVKNLEFSETAANRGTAAIKNGAVIVTDTSMALSGINKRALTSLGCEAHCFMADSDVARKAAANGSTRAVAAMDKAARLIGGRDVIFAVGNAPTALIRLTELIQGGVLSPALVIGVPVGFVNVIQAKEMIKASGVPYIVSNGRKGGSTVAAAICNAMLYTVYDRERGGR